RLARRPLEGDASEPRGSTFRVIASWETRRRAWSYGDRLDVKTSAALFESGMTRFDASESKAKSAGNGSAKEPLKASEEMNGKPGFACAPLLLTFDRMV